MGPRIPLNRIERGGPGFCEKPVADAVARGLSPSERPNSRLRVEIWRCESARASLRRTHDVYQRQAKVWGRGQDLPEAGVPETAIELQLVGQSQRPFRPESLRRRIPRPR